LKTVFDQNIQEGYCLWENFVMKPPAQKTCRTSDCVNIGKVVSGKFCAECGNPLSSAPSVPQCKTTGCVNIGKEVKGKFCSECGKVPT